MAKKDGIFSNPDILPNIIRPGIMLYKDDWEAIKGVTNEKERGIFVDSMIRFDSMGETPDFGENKILQVLWTFVKPKLVRDQKDYTYTIWKNRYIAATRGMNKDEKPNPDDWLRMVTNGDQLETKNIETKKLEAEKETETETEAGRKNPNIEARRSKSTQSVDPEVDAEIERQREEMLKRLEDYT